MPLPSPTAGSVIFAKNLDLVARFYRELLSLEVVFQDSQHLVLEGGGCALVVHAIPAEIASQIEIESPPRLRQDTALKPFFKVQSLALARAQAGALGGGLASAAQEWAARDFRACDGFDPEGNVFQIRAPQVA